VLLRRIGSWLRDAWLIVGISLAALCLLEAGLSLAFVVVDRLTWRPFELRFTADAYDNAPWAVDYYREHDAIDMRWEPYVYWRRAAYRGRFINVGEDGSRVTMPTAPAPPALEIFMFGGSTLWGTGVRDEFTIPSLVARELERSGLPASVTNFGESGYVSTQGLIALERQLQRGRRPDLVVFYDGINDTFSSFQQGEAGLAQNEYNRVNEFNLLSSDRRGDLIRTASREAAQLLSTTRLLDYLRRKRSASSGASQERPPLSAAAADELARQTLQIYATNMEIVRMLGAHYGFAFLAYWQPSILDKPHLTRYESGYRAAMEPMEPFFRRTYDLVRQGDFGETHGVRDISLVFSDVRIPIFVDEFHLGDTGNEMVAGIIASDVLKQVAERPALRKTTAKPRSAD
jgi:lysophospholipase L1-like esterase